MYYISLLLMLHIISFVNFKLLGYCKILNAVMKIFFIVSVKFNKNLFDLLDWGVNIS